MKILPVNDDLCYLVLSRKLLLCQIKRSTYKVDTGKLNADGGRIVEDVEHVTYHPMRELVKPTRYKPHQGKREIERRRARNG